MLANNVVSPGGASLADYGFLKANSPLREASPSDRAGGLESGADGVREKVVLLVDENADDATLAMFALQRIDPALKVRTLPNAESAMRYFRGEGAFGDRERFPLPSLLLVDLHMAMVSGFELLEWVRRERAMEGMGIIAMSGTDNAAEARRAYECGADSYLVKPAALADWMSTMEVVVAGWFRLGELPRSIKYPPP